ncbi:MAG: peptide/nickel transport system substrate-binding protein [Solirubrobacteraceae bacterium]
MNDVSHNDEFVALWSSPTTRRDLLRGAGLGAGALAAGGLLSACGSTRGSAAVAPKAGGNFPAAMANSFTGLNVGVSPTVGGVDVVEFWGGRLYRISPFPPRGEITPELATEMPREVSTNTFRIKLAEGVTFHNGQPFTAEDVVYTLGYVNDPKNASFFAQFLSIVKAKAVGPHELELTLSTPTALLAERLALVPITPKGIGPKSIDRKPVGTGPYRVVSVVSGRRVRLEKFEKYTGKRPPTYDALDTSVVTDANARVSGLRTGQFRAIENVPGSAFKQLSGSNGVKDNAVDSWAWTALYFNCAKPPFNDAKARQAILYAIDRDSITKSSYFGLAEAAWSGFVSPSHPEYVQPNTVYRFDPDHAKQLLSAAGVTPGTAIDVLVPSDVDFVSSQGPVVEQNLRDVGLKPNMVPGETLAGFSRMAKGDFSLNLGGAADLSIFASSLTFLMKFSFTGPVPTTYAHWTAREAEQLAKLLSDADALPSSQDAKRTAMLAQAQNLIQDQVPIAAIHHPKQLTGWSEKLHGFRPLPYTGFHLDGVRG